MEYRQFGKTDLRVSVVGFGAWGIGGPAMVGSTPIGWGEVDDAVSKKALLRAKELGINFFDTADFYGLGHSEELIGEVFGNSPDVIIASKAGHRATAENTIALDYSKKHILAACEKSLRRLHRDTIDYYQLHSARMSHLQQGECIEAMEQLKKEGKIRSWGLSLNTFHPDPESDFLIERELGDGFQLVFNIINQRARGVIEKAAASGYGIIARMPLQFGLLTGRFTKESSFSKNDHRSFRLSHEILEHSINVLQEIWQRAEEKNISKTTLALSFCTNVPGISTVIPGIKTPEQAEMNTAVIPLSNEEMRYISASFPQRFAPIVDLMERQG
jgi:aryl-alcohol dehydrogenase-like predicted oxidoreductase